MKAHAIADLFPMLSDPELEALALSMRTHGFDPTHPVLLLDGKILDGRNRWQAAKMAGVTPVTKNWDGGGDPWDFVWRENAIRRHLEPGTKTAICFQFLAGSKAWQEREGNRGKHGPRKRGSQEPLSAASNSAKRNELAAAAGVSLATAQRALAVAAADDEAIKAVAAGTCSLADAVRSTKRKTLTAKLEDVAGRNAKAATGVYDVVVIDPPWPMQKIERDERPNQVAFDYPTMAEEELEDLEIPCADACHVWLWTTHKFLPMALRLLEAWNLSYVCTFVWHKPGGFQPIGLPQYNCEFALYARRGSPSFIDTKALPVCFEAPRGKHSEKPEAFYEVLRRVTGGRRLDMFNRRAIEGFDGWGKEASAAE